METIINSSSLVKPICLGCNWADKVIRVIHFNKLGERVFNGYDCNRCKCEVKRIFEIDDMIEGHRLAQLFNLKGGK